MIEIEERPTLRNLPLPAKLVVTFFLISVSLGYCWAMLQLHFKGGGTPQGELLPTPGKVVTRYAGKPWPLHEANPKEEPKNEEANPFGKLADGAPIKTLIKNRCVVCHSEDGDTKPHLDSYEKLCKCFEPKPGSGKIHRLITAPPEIAWGKDSSMRLAFTEKSDIGNVEWEKAFPNLPKEQQQELLKEREAERLTIISWLETGASKQAYDADLFKPEKPAAPIVETRESRAKRSQIKIEELTQSTHAHLLTFALLWAATGLVFAFTSYSLLIRSTIAPIVLFAQVIDIGCWWLARLPDVGPYFALAILGTGAIVGLGLGLQIVLSLFNMYGGKGKLVVAIMLLVGAASGGLIYSKYIVPMMAEEKQAAAN